MFSPQSSDHPAYGLVLPLSLERTKSLINQAVMAFLQEETGYLKAESIPPIKHEYPSQSPLRPFKNQRETERGQFQEGRLTSHQNSNWPLDKSHNILLERSSLEDHPEYLGFSKSSMPSTKLGTASPVMAPTTPRPTQGSRILENDSNNRDKSNSDVKVLVFRQLEAYLIACLKNCDCLNASFMLVRPQTARASSEASLSTDKAPQYNSSETFEEFLPEVDAKTLLLGDIGENGLWWMGGRRHSHSKAVRDSKKTNAITSRKSIHFDWVTIDCWYDAILTCGRSWKASYLQLPSEYRTLSYREELEIDEMLANAQLHVQRTFLKAIETLLRRPGRMLKTQDDYRFILILLANPLLFSDNTQSGAGKWIVESRKPENRLPLSSSFSVSSQDTSRQPTPRGSATGQHTGILKRILGLISNLSSESHQVFVSWFCRVSDIQFQKMIELIGGFVSYRLNRQHGRKSSISHDLTAGLIPNISGPGAGTSAHLHAALGISGQFANKETKNRVVAYEDDWQIKAAAKVMSLLFSANIDRCSKRSNELRGLMLPETQTFSPAAQQRVHRHSQLLPTSAFYNLLLDHVDLITDFENWESRTGKFCFCQYPIFLSIWAKIRIMEYDARRQMEVKARDAFFTSILSRKSVSQHLVLKVRRDCLVDDSLRSVSEVIGSGQEEIKKALRIEFLGEEGIDAGG